MTPLGTPTHHDHAVRDANARWALGEQRARVEEANARPRRWSLSGDYADASAHLVVLIEGPHCWYWTGERLTADRALAMQYATVADASAALAALRERFPAAERGAVAE